jgi:hypothetical protein
VIWVEGKEKYLALTGIIIDLKYRNMAMKTIIQ